MAKVKVAHPASSGGKDKISHRCEKCGHYNDVTFGPKEVCDKCGVILSRVLQEQAVVQEPSADYDLHHPWLPKLTIPEGMINARPETVTARPLAFVKANEILLPDNSTRSAGWFMVGYPADVNDIEQRIAQEMTVTIANRDEDEPIEVLIGPGDIVAAMDVQCWPIDLVDETGDRDRWRMVQGEQVLQVIKRGSALYRRFLKQYIPFKNESDPDISI